MVRAGDSHSTPRRWIVTPFVFARREYPRQRRGDRDCTKQEDDWMWKAKAQELMGKGPPKLLPGYFPHKAALEGA